MKDKDHQMLSEAYQKIAIREDLGKEQWDHDKEWDDFFKKNPSKIPPDENDEKNKKMFDDVVRALWGIDGGVLNSDEDRTNTAVYYVKNYIDYSKSTEENIEYISQIMEEDL